MGGQSSTKKLLVVGLGVAVVVVVAIFGENVVVLECIFSDF